MSEILNHPHDKLIKEVLSDKENVRDFFLNYLPGHIQALVDMNSLEICKDSFIEKELKEYFSDILYKVSLSDEQKGGQEGYLYILFEHKSSSEKWVALYLLRYQVKIWELYLKQNPEARKLPVIIPLLLHHGESEWSISLRFSDLILYLPEELIPYVPDFSYLLCDLYSIDDDKIRGIAIIRITLLLLKYIHHPDFPYYLQRILPLLKDLLQPGQGLSHLESIIRYIFYATDRVSVDELKEMVDEHLTKDKEDLIMTLAEQLEYNRGKKMAFSKGCSKGCRRGCRRPFWMFWRPALVVSLYPYGRN